MPGVVDRMELSKVSMVADDDSTDSLDDRYTEPMDAEKATIDRLVAQVYFNSTHDDLVNGRCCY